MAKRSARPTKRTSRAAKASATRKAGNLQSGQRATGSAAKSQKKAAKSQGNAKSRSSTKRNPKQEGSEYDLVLEMLAIEGPSTRETAVADFILDRLQRAGAEASWFRRDSAHRRAGFGGECGNLVMRMPGNLRSPRRLLMAHMDTVPLCVGSQPVRRGHLLRSADPTTGLGADDRSGCAVLLSTALKLLQGDYSHGPLTFLWTIHEEGGLHGAHHLGVGNLGSPAVGFNFDGGSAEKLTIGATGGYRMTIEIQGEASHAGMAPQHGISAVAVASLAIADLTRRGWHGLISKKGKQGTSNVGIFTGGSATNVVAERAHIQVEARSHDTAFREEIVSQIEQAFDSAADKVRNVEGQRATVKIDGRLDYESFLLESEEPAVIIAQQAVQQSGGSPVLSVANGGLDANWMVRHGVPTVTLGCGQLHQHTVKEALDVRQYHKACDVALCLATGAENSSP